MKKELIIFVLVLLVVVGSLFGLHYLPRLMPEEPVNDFDTFINGLRRAGISVKVHDLEKEMEKEIKDRFGPSVTSVTNITIESRPFSGVWSVVDINGKGVNVFEYRNSQEAEKEAAFISADGRKLGGEIIPLCAGPTARPHFFRKGKIIVLYVLDDDREILDALSRLLGPQFAGV